MKDFFGNWTELEEAKTRSRTRLETFLSALPKELDARDDAIAEQLRRDNSSAKSKLGKIYALMSDLSQVVKPYVACSKGCSGCCHMNISISIIEAERLSVLSRKSMVKVKRPVRHPEGKFSGIPCPFLVESACSVYEARPFACRAHYSFDTDAFWCHPDRANAGEMSLLRMEGAREAYDFIVANSSLRGFADIRDFFPK